MQDRYGLTFRPATKDDEPGIVALVNAASQDALATNRAIMDQHGKVRFATYISPSAERMVMVDEQAQIVGFVYLAPEEPHVIAQMGGAVHPTARNRGIGTRMVQWAEERARSYASQAAPDIRMALLCNIFEADTSAHALLVDQGFVRVREWVHLAIELTAPPPSFEPITGITIRRMDQTRDWAKGDPALTEAFEDHWGELPRDLADLQEDPSSNDEEETDDPWFNSPDFCFVALDGDAVAGLCLCNQRAIEWPESGRVGSLSVRRPYRRRGLGRALMLHAFRTFYDRGITRIVTDTDAQGFTGAYKLYQQVGMRIFRREYTYEKELRPGRELRLMTPEDMRPA